MARINLDLSKFKSSGIYTLEFDQSESITLSSQTVRLVVGFSRKGPFNAPVYLDDIKKAKKIFGDIDPLMEKRGSFFHRSLFACLRTGPVFALNLMPLNNGQDSSHPVDKVDWKSFSLDVSEANGGKYQSLYSSFYNKQRFWTPDTEAFQAIQNLNPVNKGKLISFTNLGQKPVSVLIRKASVKGFDITANEWFKGDSPSYIKPYDFISDYFIETIVVEGDWTNYNTLSIDPIYSKYFDSNGIIKDKLNSFLVDSNVNQIASFTGSIIPNLIDGENRNHFIETIINNNLASSGIMCNVNQDMLEDYDNSTSKVDMIGHNLAQYFINGGNINIDFLSYSISANPDFLYNGKTVFNSNLYAFPNTNLESAYIGGNKGILDNILIIDKTTANPSYINDIKTSVKEGVSLLKGELGANPVWLTIDSLVETTNTLRISYSHPSKSNEPSKINGASVLGYIPISGGNAYPQIVVDGDFYTNGPSKLVLNDTILVQKSGWKFYYKVQSTQAGLVAGTTNINVYATGADFSGIDLNCKLYSGTRAKAVLVNNVEFVYSPDILNITNNNANGLYEYNVYQENQLYKDIENGSLKNGFYLYDPGNSPDKYYVLFTKTIDSDGISIYNLKTFLENTFTNQLDSLGFGFSYSSGQVQANINELYIVSTNPALNNFYSIVSSNSTNTELIIDNNTGLNIKIGDYLVSENPSQVGIYTLTKVIDSKKFFDNINNDFKFTIKTNERVWTSGNIIMKVNSLENAITNYRFTSLNGFSMNDFHMPGDSNNEQSQLEKILGVLDPSQSNIMKTLASKDIITFRYIVDTFDGGLSASMYPKNLLSLLAKQRQKCLALINTPSMKKFIKSNDPLFTDEPDLTTGNLQPNLNTKYIVDGGNLSLGPSFRYSLPSEDDGAKFAGFFSPFLVARDNGKNILVPPAAYISNLFIKKFQNGTPYAIVAGTRRGILSEAEIIGLEFDFLDEDRDNLEPFGINPIIYRKSKGIMLYGNQSGYQRTLSALNSLHVRDLLITVEEAIEDILSNYVFEFNDSSTRLQIKSIIESYLSNVQSDGGIYAFSVTMDETNNTPDIIDQNVGIVDITIEPAKGLHKIINRLTVTRTGGTSSGGFSLS